jgi:hypothetical protein
MANKVITFKLDKETKNKQRFANLEGEITGTIYLDKALAGDRKEISVSVDLSE